MLQAFVAIAKSVLFSPSSPKNPYAAGFEYPSKFKFNFKTSIRRYGALRNRLCDAERKYHLLPLKRDDLLFYFVTTEKKNRRAKYNIRLFNCNINYKLIIIGEAFFVIRRTHLAH